MQLDFMRRCTQFLPLSSLQYHFSEEILHTPLSTRRGRVGGGKGFFMLIRLHCFFPYSPTRSVHSGFWMRNLQEWMRYLHLSRSNPNLVFSWAGICHTLGKRGSSFPPCLPQLTFSPAVLRFFTEVAPHLSAHSPIITRFQRVYFPPVHPLRALRVISYS